jgi:hypothetical protein
MSFLSSGLATQLRLRKVLTLLTALYSLIPFNSDVPQRRSDVDFVINPLGVQSISLSVSREAEWPVSRASFCSGR